MPLELALSVNWYRYRRLLALILFFLCFAGSTTRWLLQEPTCPSQLPLW